MPHKNELGLMGEEYTADYLKALGYEIVVKNFHSRYGEIDIVAKNDKYILFVEVKSRGENYMIHPAEAITKSKINKIIKTAKLYLLKNPSRLQPRFDVACVFCIDDKPNKIEYIQSAFTE